MELERLMIELADKHSRIRFCAVECPPGQLEVQSVDLQLNKSGNDKVRHIIKDETMPLISIYKGNTV